MTLKHKLEFKGNYNWTKSSVFGGCKAIIEVAVDGLLNTKPFNDIKSKERTALIHFEYNVRKKLEAFLFDEYRKPKVFNADQINVMYESEINALTQQLTYEDTKSKVLSVLTKACGYVLGLLALIPLGIPLCFPPVRHYIGSFFAPVPMSSLLFQTKMYEAITQIKQLTAGEIECLMDVNQDKYCFRQSQV